MDFWDTNKKFHNKKYFKKFKRYCNQWRCLYRFHIIIGGLGFLIHS